MNARHYLLPILLVSAVFATWGDDDSTLRVIAVDPPPPFSLGSTPPETVVVTFNRPVLASSLGGAVYGIPYSSTLTSPTELTITVHPSTPASSYYLTLWADLRTSARHLALELSGELTPPPDLVAELGDDLAAIRRSFLEMAAIHARLDFAPGSIFLHLTPEGLMMLDNGTFHELYALNEIYGPVRIRRFTLVPSLVHLEFDGFYHSERLAEIYLIDGVENTSPDAPVGDGSDIEADPPFYTFSFGWGDCPMGCTQRHYWDYEVLDGTAVLRNEYGDSLDETLNPRVIVGEDGGVLDGEFGGGFPSGDGVEGGSFTMRWGWCEMFMEDRDPTLLHFVDAFEVVTGLLSDLLSSGNFDGATCLGTFTEGPIVLSLPDPPPGEALYFVARGNGECAAPGFGTSTTPENPRAELTNVCLSG